MPALSRLPSVFSWLTKPADSLPESLRRRAHLLAWLLLSIFLLIVATLLLVLIVNPPDSPRRIEYGGLILGLVALVTFAYALNRAAQLLEKARQMHLETTLPTLEPVTISAGVAVFPDHASTGEALLRSADAALYRAKRAGRARVVVAGLPPE